MAYLPTPTRILSRESLIDWQRKGERGRTLECVREERERVDVNQGPITLFHREAKPSIHCFRMVRGGRHSSTSTTKMFSKLLLLIGLAVNSAFCAVEFKHHNNTEMAAALQQIHNACPDITRLYTLSETSVNGIPLYVLEMTDNPGKHEPRKLDYFGSYKSPLFVVANTRGAFPLADKRSSSNNLLTIIG